MCKLGNGFLLLVPVDCSLYVKFMGSFGRILIILLIPHYCQNYSVLGLDFIVRHSQS